MEVSSQKLTGATQLSKQDFSKEGGGSYFKRESSNFSSILKSTAYKGKCKGTYVRSSSLGYRKGYTKIRRIKEIKKHSDLNSEKDIGAKHGAVCKQKSTLQDG